MGMGLLTQFRNLCVPKTYYASKHTHTNCQYIHRDTIFVAQTRKRRDGILNSQRNTCISYNEECRHHMIFHISRAKWVGKGITTCGSGGGQRWWYQSMLSSYLHRHAEHQLTGRKRTLMNSRKRRQRRERTHLLL